MWEPGTLTCVAWRTVTQTCQLLLLLLRAAFYNGEKSKVGLAAAKTAAKRINVANLLTQNLPLPRGGGAARQCTARRGRPSCVVWAAPLPMPRLLPVPPRPPRALLRSEPSLTAILKGLQGRRSTTAAPPSRPHLPIFHARRALRDILRATGAATQGQMVCLISLPSSASSTPAASLQPPLNLKLKRRRPATTSVRITMTSSGIGSWWPSILRLLPSILPTASSLAVSALSSLVRPGREITGCMHAVIIMHGVIIVQRQRGGAARQRGVRKKM